MKARSAPLLAVACVCIFWLEAVCQEEHEDVTTLSPNLLANSTLSPLQTSSALLPNTSHSVPISKTNLPESSPAIKTNLTSMEPYTNHHHNPPVSQSSPKPDHLELVTPEPRDQAKLTTFVNLSTNQREVEPYVTSQPNLPDLAPITVSELAPLNVTQPILPEHLPPPTEQPQSMPSSTNQPMYHTPTEQPRPMPPPPDRPAPMPPSLGQPEPMHPPTEQPRPMPPPPDRPVPMPPSLGQPEPMHPPTERPRPVPPPPHQPVPMPPSFGQPGPMHSPTERPRPMPPPPDRPAPMPPSSGQPGSVHPPAERPRPMPPATEPMPGEPFTPAEKMKLRLVIILLKHGNVDSAVTEMDATENKNELVAEIVKGSYAESVALDDLAAFVARIEFSKSSAVATSTLYQEMSQNEQMRTFEILIIHYHLKQHVIPSKQSTIEATALAQQVSPAVDEILASLISDISRGEFKRMDAVHQTLNKARLGDDFLSDIVKKCLDRHNNMPFKRLCYFFKRLTRPSDLCQVLFVAWVELSEGGRGGGFESLQIWLFAKYHVDDKHDVRRSDKSRAQCRIIADCSAPIHRDILVLQYNEYIRERKFDKIKSMHEDFDIGMTVFVTIIVECISKEQMHNWYFENLMDALDRLPHGGAKCWAVEALRKKLELFGMIGGPEHFRTLLCIRPLTKHSNFHRMHGCDVERCNWAQKDMPRFFYKLLYGDISNCRLINRYTKEPLYCASWWNENVDGSRGIYTWISKEEHPDQFWKISFTSRGLVYLQNNGRPNFFLARNSKQNFPYGSEKRSSFRLHAKQSKYILLENDGHLGVQFGKFKQKHQRDTCFYRDMERCEEKIQWKLECKRR